MRSILCFIIIAVITGSCRSARQKLPIGNSPAPANDGNRTIAFRGAEGFGKYTTGGRGGKVFVVTNLDDSGAGSFREAATARIRRMIVFSVSGTIHLQTKLSIAGNVTIAGQSAPGEGICLADNPVLLGGDNIIVRFLRFRMGDRYQRNGMVDGNGGDDAFGGMRRKNIIIDHCSMSWSTDEVFSVYGGDSTTLQWNLIAEPLDYSYHFESGDKDYEHHGYGAIWGGKHASFHHNLFAHCNSRTPRFDGTRNIPEENCDFRNNVIYNWGHNNLYAGEGGRYNIVNNYYKYGPSTSEQVKYRVANPWKKEPAIPYGRFFIDGNYVDGSYIVSQNNWLGVTMDKGGPADAEKSRADQPFPGVAVNTQSARAAYERVLQYAGAVLPVRDTLDQRLIGEVVHRRGKIIDVQGGYPHGTPYEQTRESWPFLETAPAPLDTDGDGIPDNWETAHGSDPNDARDANLCSPGKSFTNLEVYLDSLVPVDLYRD